MLKPWLTVTLPLVLMVSGTTLPYPPPQTIGPLTTKLSLPVNTGAPPRALHGEASEGNRHGGARRVHGNKVGSSISEC